MGWRAMGMPTAERAAEEGHGPRRVGPTGSDGQPIVGLWAMLVSGVRGIGRRGPGSKNKRAAPTPLLSLRCPKTPVESKSIDVRKKAEV